MEGGIVWGGGLNFSVVCGDDGFCHGKPNAVTAGFEVAGSICAVETVEDMGQILGLNRCGSCIGKRQSGGSVLFF